MKNIVLLILLLTSFLVVSQTKEKETVYLLFNKDDKGKCLVENGSGSSVKIKKFQKKRKENKIYFSICDEDFVFTEGISKTDTCSIKILKNLNIVSLSYLLKKYYKENELKHQVFDKIYIIEETANNKIIKYEVYWSGEWTMKD